MEGVTVDSLYMVIGVQKVENAALQTQLAAMRAANLTMAEELQAAKGEIAEWQKAYDLEKPCPSPDPSLTPS